MLQARRQTRSVPGWTMALVVVTVLMLLFWRNQAPSAATSNKATNAKLGALGGPRACAHRGEAGELGHANGTPAALRALWQHQVTCFDIDCVETSDGVILAVHPAKLAAATKRDDIRTIIRRTTLEQVRSMGASADLFPKLDDLMAEFADLALASAANALPDADGHTAQQPLMMVDLKDDALNSDAVLYVARLAQHIGIADNIVLWFRTGFENLAQEINRCCPDVHRGLVIPDRIELSDGTFQAHTPEVTEAMLAGFDYIGPSIKQPRSWLQQLQQFNRPVMVWTLDSDASMHAAVRARVQGGITDFPIAFSRIARNTRGLTAS